MTRRRKGHRLYELNIDEYIFRRAKNGDVILRTPKHLWVWDEPPLKRYPKKPKPPADTPPEPPPVEPDSEPDKDPKPDP